MRVKDDCRILGSLEDFKDHGFNKAPECESVP